MDTSSKVAALISSVAACSTPDCWMPTSTICDVRLGKARSVNACTMSRHTMSTTASLEFFR